MSGEAQPEAVEPESRDLESLAVHAAQLVEMGMLAEIGKVRDIIQGEFCVLAFLDSCAEDVAAVEIAENVSLTRPRITQIVSSLEERGLVKRTKDDDDKRRVNITITEAGREHVAAQRRIATDILKDFLSWIGEDRKTFIGILEQTYTYFIQCDEA